MKTLAITGYPRGQTSARAAMQARMEQAWLARLNADAVLDLTGHCDTALPVLDPLDHALPGLVASAEAEAREVASQWYLADGQDISEVAQVSLGRAVEAELFRQYKELALALAVARHAVSLHKPRVVRCFDPAMAELLGRDDEEDVRPSLGGAALDISADLMRYTRDARPWVLTSRERDMAAHARVLALSDNANHARVLAPVLKALGEPFAVLDPSADEGRRLREQGCPVVTPRRSATAAASMLKPAQWLRWVLHVRRLSRQPRFGLLRTSFATRQLFHQLIRAQSWLPLFSQLFASSEPALAVTSVAIWPRFRLFLDTASRRGLSTAVVMHGNIPLYPAYYGHPAVDRYLVFGSQFKEHLQTMGHVATSVAVTGDPASTAGDTPAGDASPWLGTRGVRPRVLFLQQTFGSELSWYEYRQSLTALLTCAKRRPDWEVLIKLHPFKENTGADILRLTQRLGVSNVQVVREPPVKVCLKEADVAVALFSTTILEALEAQVPVVTMNFSGRTALMPFGGLGLAREVTRPEDLDTALVKTLAGQSQTLTDLWRHGFLADQGESAATRAAQVLRPLAASK